MKPHVRSVPLLLATLALSLAGCGGFEGGAPARYELTPENATVAPGETLTLTARIIEAPYSSLEFSVREGSAGGTVVAADRVPGTATYTAPTTPGTYHVRVRVLNGGDVAATRTSTIAVRTGG